MRTEGTVSYGGSWGGSHVPLPTTPRPNRQRPEPRPVIVLQPLTRAEERALMRAPAVNRTNGAKPVTVDEAARYVTAYRSGATIKAIARAEHRCPRTVREHLTAAGVNIRPPHNQGKPKKPKPKRRDQRLISAEDSQAIADAYRAGQSLAQIEAATGRSVECIRRHLKMHGVTMRPRGGQRVEFTDTEREQIITAYREHGSVERVAFALHKDVRRVRAVVRDADVDRNPGGYAPITAAELQRARELVAGGMSLRDAAKVLGRSHTGLLKASRREGAA